MLAYKISEEQTKKLKNLQIKFEETKFLIESFNPDKKNFIKKQSLISNIGASTRIENALLTDTEIEWIDTSIATALNTGFLYQQKYIKDKLSKDKERSIEEVAGYREAIQIVFDSYQDFVPLREADIKGLHREILKYYPKANHYLGKYKTHSNSVIETNHNTKTKKIILKTADPGIITETSMVELINWFNATLKETTWVLPLAVELVFRFLAIHPFQDGNGRISRLLFQLALLSDPTFEKVVPFVALDRIIEKTRNQYYLVLRKCSDGEFSVDPKTYKIQYFLDYMIKLLLESVDNLHYYAKKYDNYIQLAETSLKILTFFKERPEHSIQTQDIFQKLNIPKRTIQYSLNQLIKFEFLQKFGKGPASRYKLVF